MVPDESLRLTNDRPQAGPSLQGEACPVAGSPESESSGDALILPGEHRVFSYFKKPVRNTRPYARADLRLVYNLIRGPLFREATFTLRTIEDEGMARDFKANHFDYCTFSGLFVRRDRKCLMQHSGLLCLDFDHVDEPAALKKALLRDTFFKTQLAFVSPSGHGLKWIIPIEVTPFIPHEKWFTAVRNYVEQAYKVKVDASGRDVARACFLPHDPEVYINPKLLL